MNPHYYTCIVNTRDTVERFDDITDVDVADSGALFVRSAASTAVFAPGQWVSCTTARVPRSQ